MKCLKTYKKYILYFFVAITIIISSLLIFYFHNINIISTLEIKVSPPQTYLSNQIKIKAYGPLNRSFDIVFDDSTKTWNTEDLYLNRIEIIIPKHINENESFSLMVNNKSITSYKSGIKNSEIGNDRITIIKDLYHINFGDKFIYFIVFSFKRLIELKYFIILLLITTIIYILSKTKKTTIFNKIMLIGILSYGFFCLIIPAFYCFPNAEDFSVVVMTKKASILNGVIQPLATFDGRYFTNLLQSISPIAWGGVKLYKYVIFFSIVLTYFSHFLFMKSFSIFKKKSIHFILLPSFFIFSHFAIIPSIVHELYWMASSFVYLWAWNFFLIWFSLFWVMLKTNNQYKKLVYFILSFTFLVCSYGINEMMIIVNLIALIGYFIYVLKKEKSQLIHLIPFAIISIVCIYIFVSSPGNKIRIEYTAITRDFEYYTNIFRVGSIYVFSTTYRWLLNNTLIIPFSIIISYLLIDTPLEISNKVITLLIFVLLSLLYILPFLSFIPLGVEYYPQRVFNFTNWFFLVIFLLLIPLLISNNIETVKQKVLKVKPIIISLSILLIMSYLIFSTNNFGLILHEYTSGEYEEYKTEMENRYRIIEIAKQNKVWSSASVDLIKHKPVTIYFDPDVSPNKNKKIWNTSYENYFNIDELKVKNDTISKINLINKNVKK